MGCRVWGVRCRAKLHETKKNLQRAYLRIENVVKKKVHIHLYALVGVLRETGKHARTHSLTGCRFECGGWRAEGVWCRVWGVGCRVKLHETKKNLQRAYLRIEDVVKKKVHIH